MWPPSIYGYDGLGRTAFVTEIGILTGTFDVNTLQFNQATQRVTRTEFDTLNRPVTVTLNYRPAPISASADRNVQLITHYDLAGNVIGQRDALGRWTTTAYDALNRPITVTVNYENGNRLTFDTASQQLSADDPVHPPTAWTYDRGGRVAAQDDPRGITNTLTFTYDNLDRRIQTTAINLGTIGASYNALGWRTDLDDGAGSTDFTFDRLGRMTRATITPSGQSAQPVGYSYNARGERTQISYPNSGPTVQYSYWPDGQLRVVTDTTTLASYAYDN
jgi:YD repeat-containing protein